MNLPRPLLDAAPQVWESAILVAYRGSIAHGMYMPSADPNSIDDKDLMAVCVPSLGHFFGLEQFGSRGTREIMIDEWDVVAYEIRKFVSLLEKGNPNVLSLLYLKDTDYIHRDTAAKYLIANREMFVGKHVYHSFAGYAHGQLHRMTHGAFKGYMGEKRKGLVEKYGFDTKNAAHLIRLLRMAIEYLGDGELRVHRTDAAELLKIKCGEWPLGKVQEEASRLFKLAEEAYVRSPLPKQPDHAAISNLCVDLVAEKFHDRVMVNALRSTTTREGGGRG